MKIFFECLVKALVTATQIYIGLEWLVLKYRKPKAAGTIEIDARTKILRKCRFAPAYNEIHDGDILPIRIRIRQGDFDEPNV